MISAAIESAYATSYYTLIVTLVLSYTVSEIRRLIGRKTPILRTSLSFNALARDEPFEVLDDALTPSSRVVGLSEVRLACIVSTQCQRVPDGRTDRQTDYLTMANSGLCVRSYADNYFHDIRKVLHLLVLLRRSSKYKVEQTKGPPTSRISLILAPPLPINEPH